MLHLNENIEEQHPSQEDIIEDYVIDIETEGIQGITSLKSSIHNFKVSLHEAKIANSELINYISSHQNELLEKYNEIYSI